MSKTFILTKYGTQTKLYIVNSKTTNAQMIENQPIHEDNHIIDSYAVNTLRSLRRIANGILYLRQFKGVNIVTTFEFNDNAKGSKDYTKIAHDINEDLAKSLMAYQKIFNNFVEDNPL